MHGHLNVKHDLQFNISESKDNEGVSESCQAGGRSKINRYKQVEVNNRNVFWQTERRIKREKTKWMMRTSECCMGLMVKRQYLSARFTPSEHPHSTPT